MSYKLNIPPGVFFKLYDTTVPGSTIVNMKEDNDLLGDTTPSVMLSARLQIDC